MPHELADTRVRARFHGDELIVTDFGGDGPTEVARHARSRPGRPSIQGRHHPPRVEHHGARTPRATPAEEAVSWSTEAGARRVRPKMAEAVAPAKLHPAAEVDRALGTAAIAGRFPRTT